jgi:negative regulator of flagellin synthesis FlgM
MDIKQLFGGFSPTNAKNNQSDKPNAKATAETNNTADKTKIATQQEKVTLTATAARFQQVQTNLSTQPEINRERVAEIRKAIAEGTYKVDAGRLAGRMMQFESELSLK